MNTFEDNPPGGCRHLLCDLAFIHLAVELNGLMSMETRKNDDHVQNQFPTHLWTHGSRGVVLSTIIIKTNRDIIEL